MTISLDAYLHSIRDLDAQAEKLTAGLTPGQFAWRPGGGACWSIADCLEHLSVANRLYLDAMQRKLEASPANGGETEIRTAGWPSTKFVRDLEPPPPYKMRAPGKIIPTPNPDGAAALNGFLTSTKRIQQFVESSRDRRINSLRFRNPLLPILRFTIGTGLLVMAAHSRRHLWQAQQIQNDAGFPAS